MHTRHVRSILGATALVFAGAVSVGFVAAMGCSSSSTGGDNGDATTDTSTGDARADTRDAKTDTRDAHHDVVETAPDTNPEFDTNPADIGPGDSSGLFACGSESCNTLLEFCLVDPGCIVTPPPDAGSDTGGGADVSTEGGGDGASDGDASDATTTDAGTPDVGGETPACARHCVTYADADASTCLGFPSCACISAILCGSITNASCDDSSGGVVVSCKTP